MHALSARLNSLSDWQELVDENPWILDPKYITKVVERARKQGVDSFTFGRIPADQLEIVGTNWRETITYRGCNSRVRAMLDLILQDPSVTPHSRILMLEAVTSFALEIRGRFAFSKGVEYLPTPEALEAWFPVQHCDIEKPPFPPASFHVVVSNDVLEHVADLDAALAGMAHILKPGGMMISTLPFLYFQQETTEKARLKPNGDIEHLGEPEYHGNPVDPEKGALVFNLPGWDLLDRCRAAGFSDASMIFEADATRGVTGAELAGIHILRAVR